MKGRKHSDETRKKLSISHLKLYEDPEECKKISNGVKKLWDDPEYCDKQSKSHQKHWDDIDEPGQEMVRHHYIYDFNDLTKYTIMITRSEHTTIHNNLRWAKLEVPCINILKGI